MPIRYPGVSTNILDAIGDTPMLEIDGVFAKCEFVNPSGSIKARIAHYIVERAEREGLLKPGDTIVEATSGNTGNAFSMVAADKGYRMLVVMPEGLSSERVAISRAFGAEVLFCGTFHVNNALERAREMGRQPGFFFPGQFENEWNVEENRNWLGQEILSQLGDRIPDAFVHGVGTGGTLIGVGQALRAANPNVRLFAMEPSESRTILCGEVALHQIEGISDGFIPGIFARHRDLIGNNTISVSSEEAIARMRELARTRGLLCGPSSGAHLIAAQRIRQQHPELETVVTILDDEGEKYLHDFYMPHGANQPLPFH